MSARWPTTASKFSGLYFRADTMYSSILYIVLCKNSKKKWLLVICDHIFFYLCSKIEQDNMSRLNSVFLFICRHKYLVVLLFIVLVVGFIDDNSFMHRFDRRNRMGQLRSEIEAYKTQYEMADRQLREMDSDPNAIEKMAREKYFMKRPGEDVFVIRDTEEDATEVTSLDSSIRQGNDS